MAALLDWKAVQALSAETDFRLCSLGCVNPHG
jgi:hypothetical protein